MAHYRDRPDTGMDRGAATPRRGPGLHSPPQTSEPWPPRRGLAEGLGKVGCGGGEPPGTLPSQDFAPADEALWCRLTKPVPAGGLLSTLLTAAEPRGTPSHPVKEEPTEPECLAPAHADIQLLPQQAGMASILATAVINSEYTTQATWAPWQRRDLRVHRDWLPLGSEQRRQCCS